MSTLTPGHPPGRSAARHVPHRDTSPPCGADALHPLLLGAAVKSHFCSLDNPDLEAASIREDEGGDNCCCFTTLKQHLQLTRHEQITLVLFASAVYVSRLYSLKCGLFSPCEQQLTCVLQTAEFGRTLLSDWANLPNKLDHCTAFLYYRVVFY